MQQTPGPDAPQAYATTVPQTVAARAHAVVLDEGLYALSLSASPTPPATAGLTLPAIHVSAPPSDEYDPVEIVASTGDIEGWLDGTGGTVVIKSPPGGGVVLVTTYGVPEQLPELASEIRRLDQPRERPPTIVAPQAPGRELHSELVLHIQTQGDRQFTAPGWIGNRGGRLRIEAFSIRPLDGLLPSDIEYKAFGPNGRETPWVTDAKLCGTRGRSLPLTGFAVRMAAHLRDRFDVSYEGAFFDSGVAGPKRNGEPCMAAALNDPLEAISLHLVERNA